MRNTVLRNLFYMFFRRWHLFILCFLFSQSFFFELLLFSKNTQQSIDIPQFTKFSSWLVVKFVFHILSSSYSLTLDFKVCQECYMDSLLPDFCMDMFQKFNNDLQTKEKCKVIEKIYFLFLKRVQSEKVAKIKSTCSDLRLCPI